MRRRPCSINRICTVEGGLLGVGFATETLVVNARAAIDIQTSRALFDELEIETPGHQPERGLRSRLQVACIERAFDLLGADFTNAMAATVSFGTIDLKFDQLARCLTEHATLCPRFAIILRGDIERMQHWQRLRPLARLAQQYGALVVLRQPLQGLERVRRLVEPDVFTLESIPANSWTWRGLAAWMDRRGIASRQHAAPGRRHDRATGTPRAPPASSSPQGDAIALRAKLRTSTASPRPSAEPAVSASRHEARSTRATVVPTRAPFIPRRIRACVSPSRPSSTRSGWTGRRSTWNRTSCNGCRLRRTTCSDCATKEHGHSERCA